ncbi:hypothetical protein [Micromonospora sp. NPDC005367]|uniref:hypothetical protein n=1 Tax=Micromonospora sp. NPDC005367 TaxID=3155590 RepID=UPI0033A2F3C9
MQVAYAGQVIGDRRPYGDLGPVGQYQGDLLGPPPGSAISMVPRPIPATAPDVSGRQVTVSAASRARNVSPAASGSRTNRLASPSTRWAGRRGC